MKELLSIDRSEILNRARAVLPNLMLGVFTIGILLAGLAPKLNWSKFFLMQTLLAATVLLAKCPKIALCLGGVFAVTLLHSFANLYWPSLRWEIPVQDYRLHDQVSSNYSFDMAKLYLRNLAWWIPAGLACGLLWDRTSSTMRRLFFFGLIFAAMSNFIVIGLQGWVDMGILSANSGTSVELERAPALLEDSGASTVLIASALSGLYAIVLFAGGIGLRPMLGLLALLALGLMCGHHSGGRIFFLASLGSAAILSLGFLWRHFKKSNLRHRLLRTAVVLAALVSFSSVYLKFFASPKVVTSVERVTESIQRSDSTMSDILFELDPGRWTHIKVMWRNYLDHWLAGSGLGSFHGNNYIYVAKIRKDGGKTKLLKDNPSNMYLLLASAMGLGGVLLALFWFYSLYQIVSRALQSAKNNSRLMLNVVALGIGIALSVSFLVGIHIVFVSIAALIGIIAVAIGSSLEGATTSRYERLFFLITAICTLTLGARTLSLAATAPRIPEFRWQERGKPQDPFSLIVPIGTKTHPGFWLRTDSETVIRKQETKFFVELPPQYYPQELGFEVFNRNGQLLYEAKNIIQDYDRENPGRLLAFKIPAETWPDCQEMTPESYCYFTLRSSPTWTWDRQNIGAYLITASHMSRTQYKKWRWENRWKLERDKAAEDAKKNQEK